MASIGGPNIVNSGLIFGYDTGQPAFSNNIGTRLYRGRPTTNISSGIGMSTYNNVPGNVSSVLESLSETFQGAQVIKQTLTPADASGVSYLSNGNNPGIGVVTSGGGGLANRYTGHSIFFKPTVPMHSSPIFTNYSNIGGWQSSNLYEAVGDGWFRAYVTWYGASTASDGKYWAINPQQTAVGQSIVVYWAGPFKEDLNSQAVSPYIYSSRSSTDALIDQRRLKTIDVSTTSFSSTNNALLFDGSDDYIDISNYTAHQSSVGTLEAVVRLDTNSGDRYVMGVGGTTTIGASRAIRVNSGNWSTVSYGSSDQDYNGIVAAPTGTWMHVVFGWTGTTVNFYLNGTLYQTTKSGMITPTGDLMRIGNPPWSTSSPHHGSIAIARHYNRLLTTAEVQQNFQAYRLRFGI